MAGAGGPCGAAVGGVEAKVGAAGPAGGSCGGTIGLLPMAALAPAGSWSSTWQPERKDEAPILHMASISSEASLVDSLASPSDPGRPLLDRVLSKDRFLLLLMLMLSPPVVACALLSLNTSALYWIGDAGLSAAVGALLWATVGQVIMQRGLASPRSASVFAVIFPTAGLLAAAHVHRTSATYFASRLHNRDCGTSFHEKHHLQRAWLAAEEIREKCVADRAVVTGEPTIGQVDQVMPVSHCPGYEEGLAEWGGEWAYLEALEGSHHCAGWCEYSERPLWRVFMDRMPHDRCSLAASGVLSGAVYRTASQVEIYCLSVLFFSIFVFLTM